MKKLIIARHGHYDSSGNLTELGRKQIKQLAETIKALSNGETFYLISSTAKRADQSAKIISEILGVGYESQEFLWTGSSSPNGYKSDLELAVKMIMGSQQDVVILVTHLEYSEDLPLFFGLKVLGVNDFPGNHTEKGQAWYIDCENKTCNVINAV